MAIDHSSGTHPESCLLLRLPIASRTEGSRSPASHNASCATSARSSRTDTSSSHKRPARPKGEDHEQAGPSRLLKGANPRRQRIETRASRAFFLHAAQSLADHIATLTALSRSAVYEVLLGTHPHPTLPVVRRQATRRKPNPREILLRALPASSKPRTAAGDRSAGIVRTQTRVCFRRAQQVPAVVHTGDVSSRRGSGDVEAGWPIDRPVAGSGRIHSGTLPTTLIGHARSSGNEADPSDLF